MRERWKVIQECPTYEVSDLGRVRRAGKCLVTFTSTSGYPSVNLCSYGKWKQRLVHRLVLIAFDGPPKDGQEACHGEAGPLISELSNLRWGSRKENAQDRVRDGTALIGRQSARGTLTQEQVDYCRSNYLVGSPKFGCIALALKFGVNKSSMSKVLSGKSWWARDYGLAE